MNLKALFAAAQAQLLWAEPAHEFADALHVVAADLMSDVLTMDLERPLLLTSLATEQALRTAHVVGAVAVLVANSKTPPLGRCGNRALTSSRSLAWAIGWTVRATGRRRKTS